MFTAAHSLNREPGTWKGVRGGGLILQCPQGQHGIGLGPGITDHRITQDGTIIPSVVCTTHGCAFHEFVKLEEWPG